MSTRATDSDVRRSPGSSNRPRCPRLIALRPTIVTLRQLAGAALSDIYQVVTVSAAQITLSDRQGTHDVIRAGPPSGRVPQKPPKSPPPKSPPPPVSPPS